MSGCTGYQVVRASGRQGAKGSVLGCQGVSVRVSATNPLLGGWVGELCHDRHIDAAPRTSYRHGTHDSARVFTSSARVMLIDEDEDSGEDVAMEEDSDADD